MILRQNVQRSKLFRLVLVGALVVVVSFGILSSSGALGAEVQPSLGQSSLYLTRNEPSPDGAISKPLDLQLGLFQTVITGLSFPGHVLCGPDQRLYVTEFLGTIETGFHTRISRFNQDGSGQTLLMERIDWNSSSMVFSANGDLYFGTYSTPISQGAWRIPNALHSNSQFNPAQHVLPPAAFLPLGGDNTNLDVFPWAFVPNGPFQGDLLISAAPSDKSKPGGHVLRAIAPDFTSVKEFIVAHMDADTGKPFHPASLAINSQGDIFIADDENSKVLRYGPDGTAKGTFIKVISPLNIAIDPDDVIYLTNDVSSGPYTGGGLFIFDPQGKLLAPAAIAPMQWRGLTVCPPK